MVRVVFDTVVFVRSLINPYGRWGELVFKYDDKYQLFISKEIVEEYLDVLYRPELTNKFQTLKDLDLRKIIELIGQAPTVEISTTPKQLSRDPKNNKFLITAKAANANYLVSEDTNLLDIREYQGIKIVTTLQFLHILDRFPRS